MFLKLLKHDFKYYAENFMAIVVSIMCCTVLSILPNQVIINQKAICFGTIKFFSMYAVIIMLMVCSVIIGIKIFNQKFISKESYLAFSLPVTKNQQLLSNLTVCLTWVGIVYFVLFIFVWLFVSFFEPPDSFYYLYHVDKLISEGLYRLVFITNSQSYLVGIITFIVLHILMINIIYFCIVFVNSANMKRFSKLISICLFSVIVYAYIVIANLVTSYDVCTNNICLIAVALVANVVFYFSTLHILEKKIEVD